MADADAWLTMTKDTAAHRSTEGVRHTPNLSAHTASTHRQADMAVCAHTFK